MDSTAIEAIIDLTANQTQAVDKTFIPTVVIPDSANIHSLEKYQQNPTHFICCFSTAYLDAFIDYTTNNMRSDSVIYLDSNTGSAVAIFDNGTPEHPGWGYHQARVELKRTAAYNTLLELDNVPLSQLDIIDFCMDWEANITFYDSEDKAITFKSAINRIRRLTATSKVVDQQQQDSFKSSRSAMEFIEINAGNEEQPAYFQLTIPPYDDFEPRVFKGRFRCLKEDDIKLKYRLSFIERIKECIADEFKTLINSNLPEITIYLGSVKHQ